MKQYTKPQIKIKQFINEPLLAASEKPAYHQESDELHTEGNAATASPTTARSKSTFNAWDTED